MKLQSKMNGYDVFLENNILKCNNSDLGINKLNDMIAAYIAFTEYFTVNDNDIIINKGDTDIIINKDNTGNELFQMIVKFSELKAIYKELRDTPKVDHLKANNNTK